MHHIWGWHPKANLMSIEYRGQGSVGATASVLSHVSLLFLRFNLKKETVNFPCTFLYCQLASWVWG